MSSIQSNPIASLSPRNVLTFTVGALAFIGGPSSVQGRVLRQGAPHIRELNQAPAPDAAAISPQSAPTRYNDQALEGPAPGLREDQLDDETIIEPKASNQKPGSTKTFALGTLGSFMALCTSNAIGRATLEKLLEGGSSRFATIDFTAMLATTALNIGSQPVAYGAERLIRLVIPPLSDPETSYPFSSLLRSVSGSAALGGVFVALTLAVGGVKRPPEPGLTRRSQCTAVKIALLNILQTQVSYFIGAAMINDSRDTYLEDFLQNMKGALAVPAIMLGLGCLCYLIYPHLSPDQPQAPGDIEMGFAQEIPPQR